MYVRKLYYENPTGAVIYSASMQGSCYITPLSDDFARLEPLQPYADDPSAVGLMLWAETTMDGETIDTDQPYSAPDPAIEEAFRTATGVSVDVTKTPHELVFDYTPIPEPVDETEQLLSEIEQELGIGGEET